MPSNDDAASPTPVIEERPETVYVGVRGPVTDGVPGFVHDAFPALFSGITEIGLTPTGPPFVRTHEIDTEGAPLDLEVGITVDGEPRSRGRLVRANLPAGNYAKLLHIGPYNSEEVTDLRAAREAAVAWIESEQLSTGRPTERGLALSCAVDWLIPGRPTSQIRRVGRPSCCSWSSPTSPRRDRPGLAEPGTRRERQGAHLPAS